MCHDPVSEPQPTSDSRTLLEGMTSLSALFDAKAAGLNDRPILEVLLDREKFSDTAKNEKRARELAFLRAKSRELGFPIRPVSTDELDACTAGSTHGGVAAVCGDRTIPALASAELPATGFYALLEGIEDPYNFGSCIRSLYLAGADGLILSPRNWMSAAGVVAKSSAGTSERIPCYLASSEEVAPVFHGRGYRILCAGIRDSVPYGEADLKKPLLLVVGGEKRGISRALLDAADGIVRIDYARAFRGSLPTTAATAILAFEILRQNS